MTFTKGDWGTLPPLGFDRSWPLTYTSYALLVWIAAGPDEERTCSVYLFMKKELVLCIHLFIYLDHMLENPLMLDSTL